MNVVVAFVLMTIVGFQGFIQPTATLQRVEAGSPAAVAGLKPGDTVLSIAGTPVTEWPDMQQAIRENAGKKVAVVVERDGAKQA